MLERATSSVKKALSAAIVACGCVIVSVNAASAAEPVRGGTLNVGFLSDLKTLDPITSAQWTERQVLFLLFDTLIDVTPDLTLKPGLAERWTFENDGLRIVLALRKGVLFHDGTPFNAEAAKWNLDARLDPAMGSTQRSQLAPVIDSIEVVDEFTLAINLKQPYPALLAQLADRAGLMVSPTASRQAGTERGSKPVGTGPFQLREWVRGTRVSLTRNEKFWQAGKPNLDRVVFHEIPSNVIGLQRMIIGEVDYIGQLTPLDARLTAANKEIGLVPVLGNWYSLQWRLDAKPFDNPKFRQALAYGLNRERINTILWDGKAEISNGVTPKGLWWTAGGLADFKYDPARAKTLLAESGVAPGTVLTLAAPSGEVMRRLAELAKEDFDALGLKVQLAPVPQSEYYARTMAGDIKFTPMRWSQRTDPDGFIQFLFSSKGTANSTMYRNADVDKWIDEARVTADIEKRKVLYVQIQQQLSKDLPYLPIGFSNEFSAVRSVVKGFEPMPDLIPRFRDMWKTGK